MTSTNHWFTGVGYIVEPMNNRLRMAIAVSRFARRVLVVTSLSLLVLAGIVKAQDPANSATAPPGASVPSAGEQATTPANPTPSVPPEAQKTPSDTPVKTRSSSAAPSGKTLEL